MSNRKGDLSLSTNAIVVLIIAITILGLALGFTRGIFGRLGDQIGRIGEQTIVDNPPSFEKPLTLNNEHVSIRLGGAKERLGIGVYNKYGEDMTFSLSLDSCTYTDEDGNNQEGVQDWFSFSYSGSKEIKLDDSYGFTVEIGAKKGTAQVGDYICTIRYDTSTSEFEYKDFGITVE